MARNLIRLTEDQIEKINKKQDFNCPECGNPMKLLQPKSNIYRTEMYCLDCRLSAVK